MDVLVRAARFSVARAPCASPPLDARTRARCSTSTAHDAPARAGPPFRCRPLVSPPAGRNRSLPGSPDGGAPATRGDESCSGPELSPSQGAAMADQIGRVVTPLYREQSSSNSPQGGRNQSRNARACFRTLGFAAAGGEPEGGQRRARGVIRGGSAGGDERRQRKRAATGRRFLSRRSRSRGALA